MRGTIHRNLLNPKIGKILLKIDYEVDNLEKVVRLVNPRVDIPNGNIKDYDARNHPAFRGEVKDPQVIQEFKTLVARQVGPIVAVFDFDVSDLMA